MENKDFVSRVVGILSDANRLMRSVEAVLIDLIAATAPWLAPILPAFMIHESLKTSMGMPLWVAVIGAAVVEFLGLSAISTTMMLWDYNDKKRESVQQPEAKGKKKRRPRRVKGLAPVWVAASSGLFYLVVVLVVNVLLDDAQILERIAKALLSSLSVIAGLILAVRAQHARRLEAAESRRAQIKQMRDARKQQAVPLLPVVPDDMPLARRATYDEFVAGQIGRNGTGPMPVDEVMSNYGVPTRTAYRWLEKYKKEHRTVHVK